MGTLTDSFTRLSSAPRGGTKSFREGLYPEAAPAPPPPPPDLTDEQVQKARAAMVRRALMGQGLGSTFLTGPLGDLSTVPTSVPRLGGA